MICFTRVCMAEDTEDVKQKGTHFGAWLIRCNEVFSKTMNQLSTSKLRYTSGLVCSKPKP